MILFRCLFIGLLVLAAPQLGAIELADIPRQADRPDFVIFPARVEVEVSTGGEVRKELSIINRLGRTATFRISVEDISAGEVDNPINLLGDDIGTYSLKNYIFLDSSLVTLESGGVTTMPITISLPDTAPPGGLYGAVTVTAESTGSATARLDTKAASLFFVKVEGEVNESGQLSSFGINEGLINFSMRPMTFNLSYQNDGNIYLNPYGGIRVKNIFGQSVWVKAIDPWFVLPDSTRLREFVWDPSYRFGIYRATVELNRGYGDIIDRDSVWIIRAPWPILIGLLMALLAVYLRWRIIKLRQ